MSKDRADLGVTLAQRAYLGDKGYMSFIGLNKEGTIAFNKDRATPRGIKNYENSVDVSGLGIYEDHGRPFPTGKQSGETLNIFRNKAGEIVCDEGVAVDDVLKQVFEMAEAAYKA